MTSHESAFGVCCVFASAWIVDVIIIHFINHRRIFAESATDTINREPNVPECPLFCSIISIEMEENERLLSRLTPYDDESENDFLSDPFCFFSLTMVVRTQNDQMDLT